MGAAAQRPAVLLRQRRPERTAAAPMETPSMNMGASAPMALRRGRTTSSRCWRASSTKCAKVSIKTVAGAVVGEGAEWPCPCASKPHVATPWFASQTNTAHTAFFSQLIVCAASWRLMLNSRRVRACCCCLWLHCIRTTRLTATQVSTQHRAETTRSSLSLSRAT